MTDPQRAALIETLARMEYHLTEARASTGRAWIHVEAGSNELDVIERIVEEAHVSMTRADAERGKVVELLALCRR